LLSRHRQKISDQKHKLRIDLAVESGSGMLLLAERLPPARAVPAALIGALPGTATELFSPSEYDTVTVPAVIAAVLVVLQQF